MGRKVSDGNSVKVSVPEGTAITKGEFCLLGGFFGMATQSIVTNADGKVTSYNGYTVSAGTVAAKITLNIEYAEYETSQIKVSDTFNAGDKVYWDNDNAYLTTTPTTVYAGKVTLGKDANNVIWFKLDQGFIPSNVLSVVGDTGDLVTTAKEDVVSAVNEVGGMAASIVTYLRNHVHTGLLIGAPTTGSTHTDDGAYDINVDITAGIIGVNGGLKEFVIQVDYDVAHGEASPIGAENTDIVYDIVAAEAAGAVTLQSVAGAAAPAGTVKHPTDQAITTVVGHGNWIKIGSTQLHRSAAATVAQTYSNAERPSLA